MIILRPEMAVGFPIDLLQSAMSAVPRLAVEWNKLTRGVYELFTIAILHFLCNKSPQESGVFSRTFSQICGGYFNKGDKMKHTEDWRYISIYGLATIIITASYLIGLAIVFIL